MDPDRNESNSSGEEDFDEETHTCVQSDVKTNQMWDELQKESTISEKSATKANKASSWSNNVGTLM